MKKPTSFPIDNSSILFFSQLRPEHSNAFRLTVTFREAVCPEALQRAVDRVYCRFPSLYAAFQPGFFQYTTCPLAQPPKVQKDPGLLLTMGPSELAESAIRIYYSGASVSVEMFHALADGYGAIQGFRTLIAEYLWQAKGIPSPERAQMLETEPDWQEELRDAYLDHGKGKTRTLPNHYAYQLPGKNRDWQVKSTSRPFHTKALLSAAKEYGVSMTTFLSALMAEAIMDVQLREQVGKKLRPVRIMVPVDLRRLFPSKTLRNFVLYCLPTLEPQQRLLPRQARMQLFRKQMQEQTTAEYLLPQVARNVKVQCSPLFRCIPRIAKCRIMRVAYDLCGEPNSSITVTNLGPFPLSDALREHVQDVDLTMTPRRRSPYNCSIISWGDITHINICRFAAETDLEDGFFGKLEEILK